MPPPIAEADDADLAGAIRARFQPERGSHEVLSHLVAVDFAERSDAGLVGPREAADAGEPVRSERHETGSTQAARDVFNVRREPAVLVDHENARQLAGGVGRPHEGSLNLAVALRGRHGHHLDLDALVVFGHLLRPGVIGTEGLQDPEGGQAADGELLRAFQESAAVDIAMDIFIEKIEYFLRKIAGLHAVHMQLPSQGKDITSAGPRSGLECPKDCELLTPGDVCCGRDKG